MVDVSAPGPDSRRGREEPSESEFRRTAVAFVINASSDSFVSWVLRKTRFPTQRMIPTEDGVLYLDQPKVRTSSRFPDHTRIAIAVSQMQVPEDNTISVVPHSDAIEFKVRSLGAGSTEVIARCRYVSLYPRFVDLLSAILEEWPGATPLRAWLDAATVELTKTSQGRVKMRSYLKAGPGLVRQQRESEVVWNRRLEVFKRLKAQHPEWTMWKVALESQEELDDLVTEHTVRNTYRKFGEKWQRGGRMR